MTKTIDHTSLDTRTRGMTVNDYRLTMELRGCTYARGELWESLARVVS